jgi:hypothetical protein
MMHPEPTFQDYLKTYLTLLGLPKYELVGKGVIEHETLAIVNGLHRRLNERERASQSEVPPLEAPIPG